MNFDLLGSRTLSSVGLSAYRLMFPQSDPVERISREALAPDARLGVI